MHVILRPLLRYADFKGRASRAEYWLFGLFKSALFVGLLCICFVFKGNDAPHTLASLSWVSVAFGLGGLTALGLLLPDLALMARRFHDINLSAKWMWLLAPGFLLQGLRLLIGFAVFLPLPEGPVTTLMRQAATSPLTTNPLLNLLAAITGTVICIIVMIPGNKGPNRYDDDDRNGRKSPPAAPKDSGPTFDEARIDAAIAELKAEKPYKPVFDFGPGSEDKPIMAMREAVPAATPKPQAPAGPAAVRYGVTDAKPTFGRRR